MNKVVAFSKIKPNTPEHTRRYLAAMDEFRRDVERTPPPPPWRVFSRDGDPDYCGRCGVSMQGTHHPLCEARDGTPTDTADEDVRAAVYAEVAAAWRRWWGW